MREIELKAGEKRKIFSRRGSSLAETIEFGAEVIDSGEELSGTVEVRHSGWIFRKPPRRQALTERNEIEKGAWDTVFSIWVTADVDARIRLEGSKGMRLFWIIIALSMLAIAIAGVAIILSQG
jgi:hypothetical protein